MNMKTRYDDAVFKFKSRILSSAARYKNYKNTLADVNAYDLNSEEGLEQLYLDLKKVRNYEEARVARYVNEYYLPAYDNINTIQKNPETMILKEITWFSPRSGDFHGLFVAQELYHSIIRYYRYSARYNLKDEQLEKAIKDWKAAVYPKPTLKEFVLDLFKKNLQK